ncbi:MAG TPA: DUF2336 domain-containing protein [Acetobacteraceae bacterium]|nr:DUF2336 domain-containing protein [Acetobacteraceae bacterium]
MSPASAEEALRVRQGASPATSPELLATLAEDVSVTVRAALALNPATPPRAIELLARDADERVRALLARRLAGLLPDLSGDESRRMQDRAVALLTRLVADHAELVRAAIADVVKEMPGAPRELILRLARDCVASISEPVIRLSPVLTDADLLALLDSPPSAATASAVARRPDLSAAVADALVAGEDSAAIRALLENQSAQIREAALDALIARAPAHEDWHAPLVRRPELSPRAARALAEIVATGLLEVLAARADLDPGLAAELRARLRARLCGPCAVLQKDLGTEEALVEAHRLRAAHQLTEAALLEALRAGRARVAAAMLAVAGTVPMIMIDRAAALRSAKALVSLVWNAGFSMAAAVPVQSLIGHIPPAGLMEPAADGGFPLTLEEMRWQLTFLRQTAR